MVSFSGNKICLTKPLKLKDQHIKPCLVVKLFVVVKSKTNKNGILKEQASGFPQVSCLCAKLS